MELIKINNLSFTYKTGSVTALKDINLSIKKGDFITVCGKSGCGKTTLLRLLKPSVAPFGEIKGTLTRSAPSASQATVGKRRSSIPK